MIRFYIGMGIKNTVFYGLFMLLSIFTNVFTDEGKKDIRIDCFVLRFQFVFNINLSNDKVYKKK